MTELVTLANVVTASRMMLIPVFVTLIFYHRFTAALVIWIIAGLTDLLDGFLARRLHQSTSLGLILDPMADKLLLITAFVVLSMPYFEFQPIPFWLTAVVISRDVFIVMGAFLMFMATGFRRFRPSPLGKLNTLVQLGLITTFLVVNMLGRYVHYLHPLYYVTLAMAIVSGIHYIFHAARLLSESKPNDG